MKHIYTIILFVLFFNQVYAHNPVEDLKEIQLTGLTTTDGYTFHFYSADGKLNRGFSEVYISLTDNTNKLVENYTVSDFRPLYEKESVKNSTPIGKVEKIEGEPYYKTWFSFLTSGTWSLSFNYTIGNSAKKSSVVTTSKQGFASKKATIAYDTITKIGWFKDRHCTGAVTLPLTKSCGIGCGTGAGNMANCWNGGLGVFIYDSTETGSLTKAQARSSEHFLLFDTQSKELVRAFLISLPSDASGKISVKVTGYWVEDGISANSTESDIPELSKDSVVHYLKAFHVLSLEGTVIPNQIKSYSGFATNTYKITPQDLAPSSLRAFQSATGTTLKFSAPYNAGKSKSNLTGYKLQVYNENGEVQSQYSATVADSLQSVDIAGVNLANNYSFSLTALYPASAVEVESEISGGIETHLGWFKDRDCIWDSVTLPLTKSCWIDCGTGSGNMAWCWNSGLGIFIYKSGENGKISVNSARSTAHYILADAQSKELIRTFLIKLPSDITNKISVKVTGYWISKGISSNKTEYNVPEIIADSVDHYLDAFHILSIEGTVIPDQSNSYTGFANNTYKTVPQDLAPSVQWIANFTGGTTVNFTAPENKGNINSTLTGYKVKVYNNAGELQSSYTTIKNDTIGNAIDINGYAVNKDYKYAVSALYAGSSVEVESELSNALKNSITNVSLAVDEYPSESKWIESFTFNNTKYYLSLAYPKSLVTGSQTIKAYINKQGDTLQPYQPVDGGFKIVPKPFMLSMGHGSSGNTNLEWNTESAVYNGTLNFSMEGDWRINLKLYDAVADTLIAGTDIDENGDGSTLFWDIYLQENSKIAVAETKEASIFPTVSRGEINIITSSNAKIKVIDLNGRTIEIYQSTGSKTIYPNVQSGLYFISVESQGKTSIQKVIIKK